MTTSPWTCECQIGEQQLLQCVVEVARAAFRAEAASVFVVDDETGELVFEAVAGRGEDHLIGTRLSEGTGIAGWVAACGQPVLADDLSEAPFSHAAAEKTGYVPRSVAAAPLLAHGTCVGVLEVLDRTVDRDELSVQELLGLLASQAAVGLELLQRVRQNRRHVVRPSMDPAANAATIHHITSGLPNLNADESRLLGQILALANGLTDLAAARTASS
jgi:GAF domain-containing protein